MDQTEAQESAWEAGGVMGGRVVSRPPLGKSEKQGEVP